VLRAQQESAAEQLDRMPFREAAVMPEHQYRRIAKHRTEIEVLGRPVSGSQSGRDHTPSGEPEFNDSTLSKQAFRGRRTYHEQQFEKVLEKSGSKREV